MTTPEQGIMDDNIRSRNASRILIVDDEEIIRALLSEILSDEGFEVTTASDGNEAIELLNSDQFDLVISDMVMPGVGGIEVLQEAFKIDPDYAVIIITGYPSVDTAVKLVNLGAADYITKPFNVDIIKITVAKVLEMKKVRNRPPESESANETGGFDPATGVYSQSIFYQLLSNEVGSARLRNQTCSLVVIGIENFDRAALARDPQAANSILKNIADSLRGFMRPGDTIGRTEEAEFGLILPQTDLDEARMLARKINNVGIGGFHFRAGSACYPHSGDSSEYLMLAARREVNAAIR